MRTRWSLSASIVLALASCTGAGTESPSPAPESTSGTGESAGESDQTPATETAYDQLTYEVIATYPHDPNAFTQGLEMADGVLYESTGQYGQSDRRIVDLETGNLVAIDRVDAEFFAEGLTLVNDSLIQLTWQNGVAIVADNTSLAETGRFSYETEGWGLCLDSDRLVMSDGSSSLTFRNPATFEAVGSVEVRRNGAQVDQLNELECVDGVVYANVWRTTEIVTVDPGTGEVTGTLDLSDLVPEVVGSPAEDVLNGIAYRADTGTFLVTGKRWPVLYEIRIS